MNLPTLLVIDDEQTVLDVVRAIGVRAGFDVLTCATGHQGIEVARTAKPDLVMVDLRMPDLDGLQVLRAIQQTGPSCQMVLMTGYASVETAVEAIKIGAMDYLSKPLDVDRVEQLLLNVCDEVRKRRQAPAAEPVRDGLGMIGQGPAMRHLVGAIERLAPFIRTALITGETGVGKELAARAIHRAGRRGERPFVVVNCSAVVESLFESELFGHVRGAFAWATDDRAGLFEAADGGVLLLDEVGDLPLGVQAKLLRVLELGEVYRVGSLEPRRVDVQVLAATNRDLRNEVLAGRFRSDLFYRLNIVEVRIPPLRERREDIPHLARAFVQRVRDATVQVARRRHRRSQRAAGGRAVGRQRARAAQRDRARVSPRRRAVAHGCRHRDLPAAGKLSRHAERARLDVASYGSHVGGAYGAAAARDRRARPHPARAAACPRQQEGGGAAARRQPARAVSPARTARPGEHDHPAPRSGRHQSGSRRFDLIFRAGAAARRGG